MAMHGVVMGVAGVVGLMVVGAPAMGGQGAEPIRTLLVTGQNNHNWWYTSRVHQDTLEATGRFDVNITEHPGRDFAKSGFLSPYQLIVLDYNANDRWSPEAEKAFLDAVKGGAGVVVIHAANNAFPGWAEYEKMVGLLWREGTGHGAFHEFTVEVVDKNHPITKGLADFKTPDELYHRLVNSQNAEFGLLARAMSSTESGGTGKNEPMAMTLQFGKGRVFHTPLGHVWKDQEGTKVSVVNPGFRSLLTRGAEWAATGAVTLPATWSDTRTHNTLSEREKADGWTLLFDGASAKGWHGWKKTEFPSVGWGVKDGLLMFTPGNGGGDIATDAEFGDFELSLEWRVGPGGNSGIMYRCTEDKNYPWETGREFQILDDARHNDGKKPKTRAGTMYDVFACAQDVSRPAMEWNHARIVARGTRLEHWLNGIKVVDIDTASEEYAKAVAASKFPGMPDYGKRSAGKIALQDHGDPVWYRNIKIRKIQ